MWKEFKEFALKGNMVDLAVGIIIGSAFTAIITSIVDDLIMPLLGLITGNIDFSNLFIALDGNKYATVAQAEEAGAAVLKYGAFIGAVINFVIIAVIIFLMVKGINTMRNKLVKEEEAAPTVKTCPHCQTEIPIKATRCPHCTSALDDVTK